MLKKIIVVVILIMIFALAGIYFYRHAIIKHYAEKIVRENLPGYIKIDKVDFDFANNKVFLKNFRVLNAPGFPSQFFLKVNDISCRYDILGRGIPTGLEISEVSMTGADIRIERLRNGRVNAAEMENFVKSFEKDASSPVIASPAAFRRDEAILKKETTSTHSVASNDNLAKLLKLPDSFDIKNARLVFLDKVPYENPYIITIEPVNGQVSINFTDNYSKINNVSYALSGNLNGDRNQSIQWLASLDPNKPKLTMSNRFDVSGLELLTFEPYYDSFSPLIFKRGRVSGTLVFDFNNGNIGSTNEIYLSGLVFAVKRGYENSEMWGTTVPEIMRYFTTTSGDVVFDFKLKGDMNNPTFYLGPISKRAMTSMVVDKIASYAIDQATKQQGGANNDIDKAKQAIDMVRQFLKKQ